jgi:hypothetical protein
MTPQERAQALIRVKKGDYLTESHPRFIRSEGKTGKIIKNPRYENSLAHLLGWTPANEDLDVMMDEQGADRPGYEPEPDAKRVSAAVREKYEATRREARMEELTQMFREAARAARDRADKINGLQEGDQNPSDEQIETLWREVSDEIARQETLREELSDEFKTLYGSGLDMFSPWSSWTYWNNAGLDSLRAQRQTEPSQFDFIDD